MDAFIEGFIAVMGMIGITVLVAAIYDLVDKINRNNGE